MAGCPPPSYFYRAKTSHAGIMNHAGTEAISTGKVASSTSKHHYYFLPPPPVLTLDSNFISVFPLFHYLVSKQFCVQCAKWQGSLEMRLCFRFGRGCYGPGDDECFLRCHVHKPQSTTIKQIRFPSSCIHWIIYIFSYLLWLRWLQRSCLVCLSSSSLMVFEHRPAHGPIWLVYASWVNCF